MRFARAALALAFIAPMLSAEEPPAPLSETREQLKSLRKDQSARKSGEAGPDLRDALPSFVTPVPGAPTLDLPASTKTSDAEKKALKKNWLLDRYDSLDPRKTAARHPPDRSDDDVVADEELDPDDPEYFLKLYERQRRDAADKEMQRVGDTADSKSMANPNPFTPFMQNWLAGSPVRDLVRGTMADDATAPMGTSASGAAGLPSGAGSPSSDSSVHIAADSLSATGTAPRTAANPYLEALTLPAIAERETAALPPAPVNVLPEPARNDPAPILPKLTPQDELRRALPSGADDAKKYFPQLKKF